MASAHRSATTLDVWSDEEITTMGLLLTRPAMAVTSASLPFSALMKASLSRP